MNDREKPYICQICGQVEQAIWDADLEVEFYPSEEDEDVDALRFDLHAYEFRTCRIWIRVCDECSKMGPDLVLERYQERVRAGEIERFH